MEFLQKAFEILKNNNMLNKQLMDYCTLEDSLLMRKEERPIRKVNNDLVFYTAYFGEIEDIKEFNRKKYKNIQGEKYKIIRHNDLNGGIIMEVPKYIIKNYFNNHSRTNKFMSEEEVIEVENKDFIEKSDFKEVDLTNFL